MAIIQHSSSHYNKEIHHNITALIPSLSFPKNKQALMENPQLFIIKLKQ